MTDDSDSRFEERARKWTDALIADLAPAEVTSLAALLAEVAAEARGCPAYPVHPCRAGRDGTCAICGGEVKP
jgi:hypothetical protein